MKKRILVTSSHWKTLCQNADRFLKDRGYEVVVYQNELPYMSFEEQATIMPDIDGAIIGLDQWTDRVFAISPRLKAIAKFGVGVDNIDCDSAARRGIAVLNAPRINSNACGDMVVSMILNCVRNQTILYEAMKEGRWERFVCHEMNALTIGLYGFGAIARLVAKKLSGFECRIITYDICPDPDAAAQYGVEYVDRDTLFKESDVLSIHIPYTRETYHSVNDEVFSKMKPGAYLVNGARGAIVDSDALIRAVQSGKLSGAALDVFENEPLKKDDPLLLCKKIICTPHSSAETYETYNNVSMCVAEGIVDVLEGRTPKYRVN